MAEKFSLNWHTFVDHTSELFDDLYSSKRYADITLVSDDQTKFIAHKFVLYSEISWRMMSSKLVFS